MENKKKKYNHGGFSAIQFFFVVIIAGILVIIVSKLIFNVDLRRRLGVMAYNATLFGYNSANYQEKLDGQRKYLKDFVDEALFDNIKDPFLTEEEFCDGYDSFITYENNKKYVTLRCGKYLVDRENVIEEEVTIYEVSDWFTSAPKASRDTIVEEALLYASLGGQSETMKTPRPAEAFLRLFNDGYGTHYQKIEDIPEEYQVEQGRYYRTKTVVYRVGANKK